MSPWASGDSLTPSTLNAKMASATSALGFSTNTIKAESGGATLVSLTTLIVNPILMSGATNGVLLQAAGLSGVVGNSLTMQNLDADGKISVIVAPGSNLTALSGRNAQILIYGITGNNYERFSMTYNNGGWKIESTALGSGVARAIAFDFGGPDVLGLFSNGNVAVGSGGTNDANLSVGTTGSNALLVVGDTSNNSHNQTAVFCAPTPRLYFQPSPAGGVRPWRLSANDDFNLLSIGAASSSNTDATAATYASVVQVNPVDSSLSAGLLTAGGAGTALMPNLRMGSEVSLGFYRSAASIAALSYGFLQAPAFISSSTTNQSASSAKITNQGQIVFSILSLTTNGAAMYYRSGNSVFGWASNLVVG